MTASELQAKTPEQKYGLLAISAMTSAIDERDQNGTPFMVAATKHITAAIAAAIQAERDRHEAELAQAVEATNTGARFIAFQQAADAMCAACREGNKPIREERPVFTTYRHGEAADWVRCEATPIYKLMAAEGYNND